MIDYKNKILQNNSSMDILSTSVLMQLPLAQDMDIAIFIYLPHSVDLSNYNDGLFHVI